MKTIPTLFVRDPANMSRVTQEVTPGCEWVLANEGVATRKWDGTACLVRDGKLYKRMKWAAKGLAPAVWLHHDFDPNQRSGHGWYPVGDGPDDWMHRIPAIPSEPGTYELCGPKIGKNPEGLTDYQFIPHGNELLDTPRDFAGLSAWLATATMEGIVWHHPDGRMAKIKRRDYGYPWPLRRER